MKIIGRTEAGARLVEISTEELIRINSAAQTLNSISLELGIVIPAVPLAPPVEQSEKKKTKERKTQAARTKLPTDGVNRHKTCDICGKGFVDKSRTNSRKICNKTSCKHEQKKKYQRNWMREKHGIKNPRIKDEQKTILPAGNPANPSLTNEQRLKLKANREDVLRTINKRLEASGN